MASDIIERWKASALFCIASALSTALSYPCQIRVHQRWQSKLQLSTARKKEWRPAIAGSCHGMRLPVNTVIHTTLVGLEPTTSISLADCWSDELPVVPPTHQSIVKWSWSRQSTSVWCRPPPFTHRSRRINADVTLCGQWHCHWSEVWRRH